MSLESNKSINAFLANASHEIRTQLTAVQGYSELLLHNKQSEMDRNNSIQTMIRSSRHLQILINKILEISKIQSDQLALLKVDISGLELHTNEKYTKKINELLEEDFESYIELSNSYNNVVTGKVLLAEDNIDNQELISLYIKAAGAEVDVAHNGEQAVKMALQNNYDLVLMDMNMPVMGGIEAISILKSAGYQPPIVALTANTFLDTSENFSGGGCDDFLTKPIERNHFYDILREYLKSSTAETIPLRSSLLKNEPELKNLIKKYINKYPSMIFDLKAAFENEDYNLFEMLLHDIKSTGGNYGFMLITDLSVMIKTHLNNNNIKAIIPLLDELETLHKRMVLDF